MWDPQGSTAEERRPYLRSDGGGTSAWVVTSAARCGHHTHRGTRRRGARDRIPAAALRVPTTPTRSPPPPGLPSLSHSLPSRIFQLFRMFVFRLRLKG
ncbi:Hypothetical protein NTJ_06034 [Nesidiocoris tenuis]|uniref:Uncharacterized protein n=1 Tax=Nesidiocoris tenuis TaxID=355587 RepID=A0ABN7AQN5_9HEMI|nr:Hypothetical protein NTJ_06034 [Nesidiocoris tenuis]